MAKNNKKENPFEQFVPIKDPDGVSQPYDDSQVLVSVHNTAPQVTVWGNDDTGYYKVFESRADAKTYFRQKIPALITFQWLIAEGFLDWNTDAPIKIHKGYGV